MFGERDRALIFRGWSRLCVHAASLSSAEGASEAAVTAVARAARAEAMEKEATAAANAVAKQMEEMHLVRRHNRAMLTVSLLSDGGGNV